MAGITFLELDVTGSAISNRFLDEVHTLIQVPGKTNRVFVCDHGGYFTRGFGIRDANGRALIRGLDYVTTYHYEALSELTGQEVMGLVVIKNPAVRSPIRVSYQAVGGFFSVSAVELKELLDQLAATETLRFKWEDIIGKPTEYVPSKHMHKYWQLYGLESTVTNIDRLGDAWRFGRTALLREGTVFYKHYTVLAQQAVDEYIARVNAHLNDRANPHQSNKVKIGLGNINNWPLSTAVQTLDVANTNTYFPIGGTYNQIQSILIPKLTAHIRDQSNPHGLTLAILNLFSRAEIDGIYNLRLNRNQIAFSSKLLAGQSADTLYTAARTNLAVQNVNQSTRFKQNQIAPNVAGWAPNNNPTDFALVGNNAYRSFTDLFRDYNSRQSGYVYLPGVQGNEANALMVIIQQAATGRFAPGTYVFTQFAITHNHLTLPTMCVAIVNPNGTTVRKITNP